MTTRPAGNAKEKGVAFTIPGPLPSLNKLMRMHWAKRRRLKVDYKRELWMQGGIHDIFNVLKRKQAISIIVYQPFRRFDEDNLVGATKPLVDALRETGFIYRDSPRWLKRKVRQEIDRKNPRVEITVEEA